MVAMLQQSGCYEIGYAIKIGSLFASGWETTDDAFFLFSEKKLLQLILRISLVIFLCCHSADEWVAPFASSQLKMEVLGPPTPCEGYEWCRWNSPYFHLQEFGIRH